LISKPDYLKRHYDPVLDDPTRWVVGMRPPFFDREAYQREIDGITGLSGVHSIMKLEWMPEVRDFEYGGWRQRYVSQYDEEGQEVSPPRWVIQERFEPGQYWDAWEAARKVFIPTGEGEPVEVDPRALEIFGQSTGEVLDRGEPPKDGWYGWAWTCASHDGECCQKARADGEHRKCQGYYKDPGEEELNRLRWGINESRKDKLVHPHEPLTREDLEEIRRASNYETEQRREAARSELVQRFTDFYNLHAHRLSCGENPKHLKHGKYTFTHGWQETPSGIVIPN
jgi:hypothetical protein